MSSLQMGTGKNAIRRSFSDVRDVVPVPNLIEVQSKSFNDFVQLDYLSSERQDIGLQKVLKDIFPVEYNGKMSLEFISYELGNCASTKKSGVSCLATDKTAPKKARYKTCASCLSRVTIQLPMTVDECRANGQTFSM